MNSSCWRKTRTKHGTEKNNGKAMKRSWKQNVEKTHGTTMQKQTTLKTRHGLRMINRYQQLLQSCTQLPPRRGTPFGVSRDCRTLHHCGGPSSASDGFRPTRIQVGRQEVGHNQWMGFPWAFLYSFLLKPPVDGGKPMDGNYIGNLIHRLTTQVAATRASALASAWSLDHLDSGYVDALG